MMGVFWLLIILHCCTSPNRCDVLSPEQPWDIYCRTAEKTNSLSVPCPKIKSEHLIMDNQTDITITLYRNWKEIYKICTEPSKKNQTIRQHGVTPQKEHGKWTGFIIKLEGNIEQAVYTCKVEKSYPPPFVTSEGKSVVVLDEGQGCANKTGTCKKNDSEPLTPQRPIWIWILVVALLCTYSLAVTIAALVIWEETSSRSRLSVSSHLLRPTGVQGDRSRDTKSSCKRRPRPGNTQPGRRAPSQPPCQRIKRAHPASHSQRNRTTLENSPISNIYKQWY